MSRWNDESIFSLWNMKHEFIKLIFTVKHPILNKCILISIKYENQVKYKMQLMTDQKRPQKKAQSDHNNKETYQ